MRLKIRIHSKHISPPSWVVSSKSSDFFENKQETLHVITFAIICSALGSLWNFQDFQRPIYNPVEHLWWSFYYENSKPLSIFRKKAPPQMLAWFLSTPELFGYSSNVLFLWSILHSKTLEACYSILKYFTYFNSSSMLLNI